MIRRTPTLFLVLSLWIPLLAEAADPEWRSSLEDGRRLLEERRYEEAVVTLERAHELSGETCTSCLWHLGSAHLELGDDAAAARATVALLDLEPGKSRDVLKRLTAIYDRLGQLEEAVEASLSFADATSSVDRQIDILNDLGLFLATDDAPPVRLRMAADVFNETLKRSKARANRARLNLAEVLWRLGNKRRALELVGKLFPPGADRWPKLGRLELNPALAKALSDAKMEIAMIPPAPEKAKSPVGPIAPGQLVPPKKINAPHPGYTSAAQRARIQGVVILQVKVGTDGRSKVEKVLKELPHGLTERTVETVEREWRWQPGTLDGKPIETYYNVTINFRLR